jgi:NAD(P)-dependent dehydrogenase (short-subunit alcohol dehydrogenase family)
VLAVDALDQLQKEFDTNVFGPLAMSRSFAPTLAANGGGAIVNVLSVLSWYASSQSALYCAAKSASWSLTNSLRLDLLAQRTRVVAVHVAYMDTDMTAALDVPKSSPYVARLVLDAVETGGSEVLADDVSRRVKAALSGALSLLYPMITS